MLRRGIAVVTAVAIWHLAASLVGSVILPTPLDCLVAAQRGLIDGSLGSNALASLTRVAIGYVMAAVAGVLLGALSGLTSSAGLALRDILELLRPIPPVAWEPIAILWFGLGDSSAWFVVFVGAFFPIFIQVSHAFSTCDEAHLEVVQAYEASEWVAFWWVRLPAAAPDIAQSLRVGLGLAWTSVIAAELVGVNRGLGDRIQQLRYVADYEGMVVCMITIGLLGWSMTAMANRIQQWVIPWHRPSA